MNCNLFCILIQFKILLLPTSQFCLLSFRNFPSSHPSLYHFHSRISYNSHLHADSSSFQIAHFPLFYPFAISFFLLTHSSMQPLSSTAAHSTTHFVFSPPIITVYLTKPDISHALSTAASFTHSHTCSPSLIQLHSTLLFSNHFVLMCSLGLTLNSSSPTTSSLIFIHAPTGLTFHRVT